MGGVLRPRGRTILPVLLCLSWAGCSRPSGVHSAESDTQSTQHPAPFRDGNVPVPQPETSVAQEDGASSEAGVPFRDSQSLPVGTLLTVRLENPINSDPPEESGTFVARVDEPVVVEGATVVPRGAGVAGRIESTHPSTSNRSRGYLRLTLDQVDIAGQELPIRTSSLFARCNVAKSQGHKADVVSLEQGRRLTFRLTEPVYVTGQSLDSHR